MDVSSVLLYLGTMLVVEPLYLLGIHLSNLVISLYEIVTSHLFLYLLRLFFESPLSLFIDS